MGVLDEIHRVGLIISLDGERVKIANPKKLTDGLRNLIRTNKQEIVKQLLHNQLQQDIREQIEESNPFGLDENQDHLQNEFPKVVTCFAPSGKPIKVVAKDAEHAEFLQRMNPPPRSGS